MTDTGLQKIPTAEEYRAAAAVLSTAADGAFSDAADWCLSNADKLDEDAAQAREVLELGRKVLPAIRKLLFDGSADQNARLLGETLFSQLHNRIAPVGGAVLTAAEMDDVRKLADTASVWAEGSQTSEAAKRLHTRFSVGKTSIEELKNFDKMNYKFANAHFGFPHPDIHTGHTAEDGSEWVWAIDDVWRRRPAKIMG